MSCALVFLQKPIQPPSSAIGRNAFRHRPVTQIGMIAEFAGATVCDNATQKEITLGEGYQHFSQL